MICFTVLPLLQVLGISSGVLGILAVISKLSDDYP